MRLSGRRVAKVELTFFYNSGGWESRGQGRCGRWQWCGFNASISAQVGRRRDEALTENKAEAASLSWLHVKKG
jgi:hypothetical protein